MPRERLRRAQHTSECQMLDPRSLGPHKLAALGALGACGGMALVFLVVVIFLRPFPRGGMDGTSYALTLMAIGGVLAGLVAVHLAFARQLWHAPRAATNADVARTRSKRKARS
jgi:hypothetical protein